MRLPGVELALIGITLAWGISFVLLGQAGRDAGTWGLTALRMTVGLAVIVALLRPTFRGLERRVVWMAVLGGALLAGGYALQTAGMRTVDPGAGGFLTAVYVALVPFVDAAVRRRWPTVADLAVFVVATAGIVLIAFPQGGIRFDTESLEANWGAILVTLSGICWAAQIVAVDRVANKAEPAALSAIQLAVCAAVAWVARGLSDEAPVVWSERLVAEIFFLGFVTCALAFAVQAWAQRRYSPTKIAIIFAMEPVFAALCGSFFQGEGFPMRKVAGCALVGSAVAVTLWLAARRAPPATTGAAGPSNPAPGDATLSA